MANPQAIALYKVQEIELAVIQRRMRLKQIEQEIEGNTAAKEAQIAVETVEETLKPLQASERDLQQQIESNVAKQESTEQRLYSGEVQNPKELQDMQREIEALIEWHTELGKRLTNANEAVGQVTQQLEMAQETLAVAKQTAKQLQKELVKEKAQLEKENEKLLKDRKKALQSVEQDSMRLYSELRSKKAHRPMAILNGTSCSVCGIEQSSSTIQRVKKSTDFSYCRNCGRILVYK